MAVKFTKEAEKVLPVAGLLEELQSCQQECCRLREATERLEKRLDKLTVELGEHRRAERWLVALGVFLHVTVLALTLLAHG